MTLGEEIARWWEDETVETTQAAHAARIDAAIRNAVAKKKEECASVADAIAAEIRKRD